MFLNPLYILIPISFGALLLLGSALDFYMRKIRMNLMNLQIEARKKDMNYPHIDLIEIVKE
jgi:hypothetical protein